MNRTLSSLWRSLRARVSRARFDPRDHSTSTVDSVADYWTKHNVSSHRTFTDASDSLAYFAWRNDQYFNYIDLMPVHGFGGKVVLDYGCGPGHDLVGFSEYSSPSRLIGMDVSTSSLREARARLTLHHKNVEFMGLAAEETTLPLPDASVDYIHCSGVLHHLAQPETIMREFRRILRPNGGLRVMVYHRQSLWMHLYCAYHIQIIQGKYPELPLEAVFGKMTDGENCPISRAYTEAEMIAIAARSGLELKLAGAAVSAFEMSLFNGRFEAIADPRLPVESREFLLELTTDQRGLPLYRGVHAGVDGCYVGHASALE